MILIRTTDFILNCNFLKRFVTLKTENTEILLFTNFSCQDQCVLHCPIMLKLLLIQDSSGSAESLLAARRNRHEGK